MVKSPWSPCRGDMGSIPGQGTDPTCHVVQPKKKKAKNKLQFLIKGIIHLHTEKRTAIEMCVSLAYV